MCYVRPLCILVIEPKLKHHSVGIHHNKYVQIKRNRKLFNYKLIMESFLFIKTPLWGKANNLLLINHQTGFFSFTTSLFGTCFGNSYHVLPTDQL